jgi:hypothetical protein
MQPFAILWPTFALVALIVTIWFVLFLQRMRHIRLNPPTAANLASGDAALRYFAPVEMPANNLRNLFEIPVLYFALVPLLMITHQAHPVQIALAWLFVASRVAHSVAHVVLKRVPLRAMIYIVSSGLLFAMWIGFFIDMINAAVTYDAAMANLTI